jgi:hypothetical protein
MWQTFSHEIGHNIGAEHSSIGDTHYGGIMDVAKKINGSYQFSTVFNRHNVCPVIADLFNDGCEWFTGFSPVCGNGLQEDGEECECSDESTTCPGCSNCVLTSECTAFDPHPGKAACCGADDMFKPFGTWQARHCYIRVLLLCFGTAVRHKQTNICLPGGALASTAGNSAKGETVASAALVNTNVRLPCA